MNLEAIECIPLFLLCFGFGLDSLSLKRVSFVALSPTSYLAFDYSCQLMEQYLRGNICMRNKRNGCISSVRKYSFLDCCLLDNEELGQIISKPLSECVSDISGLMGMVHDQSQLAI